MRNKRLFNHLSLFIVPVILLTGCGSSKESELQQMIKSGQQIEIEVATPIYEEQGTEQSITWIQLDQLTTYSQFRDQMDDLMKITTYGQGSKSGIAYIDLEGNQEGNNTLYNALNNRKFIANFLDNDSANLEIQQRISSVYADVDDSEAMVAAINAYWNLLPDSDPNYFNGSGTISRLEAMALIARASNQVTDEYGDTAFETQVGNGEYAAFASMVADDSYLSVDNKSLNESTASGTITRGEYIYMLISNVFGADRMSRADIKKASFNDCKDAGDIGGKQKVSSEDTNKDYYESYELKFTLDNPDDGCPTRMFRALTTAQELDILDNETRWDEGLTKTEAIQLYIEAIKAYTRLNGYAVDSTSGAGEEVEIVEAQKPIEEGDVSRDTDMTGDPYQEYLEAAEQEREEVDKTLTESESDGIEIVEELDKTMYAQQNCNARSGDGTNFEKMASITKGVDLHVTGRTSNDWYRVQWGDGVVYIAGSLLGDSKPVEASQPSGGGSSGGSGGAAQQPSGGSGGSSTAPTQQEIQDILNSIFPEGSSGYNPDPDGGNGWNNI